MPVFKQAFLNYLIDVFKQVIDKNTFVFYPLPDCTLYYLAGAAVSTGCCGIGCWAGAVSVTSTTSISNIRF